MFAKVEIVEIDGALAVIFPQDVLDALNAGLGDELDVTVRSGSIYLKRHTPENSEQQP